MTSEWPWTFNHQKYPVYTKILPPRSNLVSTLVYNHPTTKYLTFYNTKLANMLNTEDIQNKTEQKNAQKANIYNFTIL